MKNETDHEIFCHGSLITTQHILSASHCYKEGVDISKLFIVLGSREPLKEGVRKSRKKPKDRVKGQIHEIKTVISHSMYRAPAAYFDVSITKLEEKVTISKFIFPICLPTQPETFEEHEKRYGDTFIVTGFRTNDEDTDNKLHQIQPTLQKKIDCNNAYDSSKISKDLHQTASLNALPQLFDNSTMCASNVALKKSQGSCPGDSGGPFFEIVNLNKTLQRYVQYGTIHGSVQKCSSSRFPGIFVRLTEPHVFEFLNTLGRSNGNVTYQASERGTLTFTIIYF